MSRARNMQFDNIATPGAPVWRGRRISPLTSYSVRMELVSQAAALPEHERRRYLNERLTGLDKALTDDEVGAVEHWLDCEEVLQGRAKTTDYDGGGGGGYGPASPISSDWMDALESHARVKKMLPLRRRRALAILFPMTQDRDWMLTMPLISEIKDAAAALLALDI